MLQLEQSLGYVPKQEVFSISQYCLERNVSVFYTGEPCRPTAGRFESPSDRTSSGLDGFGGLLLRTMKGTLTKEDMDTIREELLTENASSSPQIKPSGNSFVIPYGNLGIEGVKEIHDTFKVDNAGNVYGGHSSIAGVGGKKIRINTDPLIHRF